MSYKILANGNVMAPPGSSPTPENTISSSAAAVWQASEPLWRQHDTVPKC